MPAAQEPEAGVIRNELTGHLLLGARAQRVPQGRNLAGVLITKGPPLFQTNSEGQSLSTFGFSPGFPNACRKQGAKSEFSASEEMKAQRHCLGL